MRYLGGKARTYKAICTYLEGIRLGRPFVEPFCGGLWITQGMSGIRYASDINAPLINLYKATQAGWIPPLDVSEEMYRRYKDNQEVTDPLTAFIGIGCSFGGKWFGGYARCKTGPRNYCAEARRSLLKKISACGTVSFRHCSWLLAINEAPFNSLVYLDPPYAGTTGYACGAFDSGIFWSIVRVIALRHRVVISEYTAPPDFKCVLSIQTKTDMTTKSGHENRTEKLFEYTGGRK